MKLNKPLKFLPFLILLIEFIGIGFTSYGLLRVSFSDIARNSGFGEGRFGEGTFGGGLTLFDETLVNIGVSLNLLPGDRDITVTDLKQNAAYAIFGFLLLVFAFVLELFERSRSHKELTELNQKIEEMDISSRKSKFQMLRTYNQRKHSVGRFRRKY